MSGLTLLGHGLDAVVTQATHQPTPDARLQRYRRARRDYPAQFLSRRAIGLLVLEAFKSRTKPDLKRIRRRLGLATLP